MFFALLTLFTALAMAGTAATFAILGIMAIFAGLPYHALVMGIVIELGKIVGVSWLYRNWSSPTKIKFAMLPLVLVAMLLTSMGIFGLLSKAHLEQTASVSNNTSVIERLDEQIGRAELDINRAESALSQLDASIDEYIDRGFVTRGLEAREAQQEERDGLQQIITESQDQMNQLEDQRLELRQQLQVVELEVGPIKYIAELVYGAGEDRLEEAVRWVIIAFIFVFDPMAILLLMAANFTLMQRGIHFEAKYQPQSTPTSVDDTAAAEKKKIRDLEQQLKEAQQQSPEVIERTVEVPVEVEKIVEVPVEKTVEKIVEVPVEVERPASKDLSEAARLLSQSEFNKEDLTEQEILDLLHKTSEDEVKRRMGFWAMPLPKQDQDNGVPDVNYTRKPR